MWRAEAIQRLSKLSEIIYRMINWMSAEKSDSRPMKLPKHEIIPDKTLFRTIFSTLLTFHVKNPDQNTEENGESTNIEKKYDTNFIFTRAKNKPPQCHNQIQIFPTATDA